MQPKISARSRRVRRTRTGAGAAGICRGDGVWSLLPMLVMLAACFVQFITLLRVRSMSDHWRELYDSAARENVRLQQMLQRSLTLPATPQGNEAMSIRPESEWKTKLCCGPAGCGTFVSGDADAPLVPHDHSRYCAGSKCGAWLDVGGMGICGHLPAAAQWTKIQPQPGPVFVHGQPSSAGGLGNYMGVITSSSTGGHFTQAQYNNT